MSPEETSWKLRLIGGSAIGHVARYSESFKRHDYNYCLEYDTCYRFSIFDSEGDGMSNHPDDSGPAGFYAVYLGDVLQVKRRGDWGKRRSSKVCTPPDPSTIVANSEAEVQDVYVELINATEAELSEAAKQHFSTSEPQDDSNTD